MMMLTFTAKELQTPVQIPQPDLAWISGSDNDDTLFAGAARKSLILARGGNDKVYGGSGDDFIDGGLGNDQIYGGSGGDTIYGGPGSDMVSGGDGDDVLHGAATDSGYTAGEDDRLDGGPRNAF